MKKKIFVRGPVLSQSGYGEQSRFALRALRSREDLFDIFIQPIPWGQTGWIWNDDDFRVWLDERVTATLLSSENKTLTPDVSLQITIPNEFEKICPINIGYTAGIETTKVSPQWLEKGNMMDKLLVVSQHAKDVYERSKAVLLQDNGDESDYTLNTPVSVVWENTPLVSSEEIEGFSPKFDFNFLCVSQMGLRKNLQNTVKWFVEEFIDQEVGLILKVNGKSNSRMDRDYSEASLSSFLSAYPNRKCSVSLLHGDLSEGQMRGLYEDRKVKALINISHGEGFGLPMYEAARVALPVITVGWSGQLDFLSHNGKDYFTKVKHKLNRVMPDVVWSGVIEEDSMWAYADQGSYKMVLRKVFKNYDKAVELATDLKPIVESKFADKELYEGFCNEIILSLEK